MPLAACSCLFPVCGIRSSTAMLERTHYASVLSSRLADCKKGLFPWGGGVCACVRVFAALCEVVFPLKSSAWLGSAMARPQDGSTTFLSGWCLGSFWALYVAVCIRA